MFDFTDFNGNTFSLPDFPEIFYNYDNYILLRPNNGATGVMVFAFNGNYLNARINYGGLTTVSYSSTDNILSLSTSVGSSSWSNQGTSLTVLTGGIFEIVGCSDRLLPYKDILVTRNFNLEIPEEIEQVATFTLRPIVEEVDKQENIIESSFTEIFSILPVLVTILISIVGIRKAISFLFSQIRKS